MALSPATRSALADRPVFDAHVDALQRALDLGHDLAVAGPGHFDLERASGAGLGAVVLVSWVSPSHLAAAARRAEALMEAGRALARRRPDRLRLVGDGPALAAARRDGAVAGVLGIEGGHAIEGSLERLERLFERGLRVMTLCWNNHLDWIRSCQEGAGAGVPAGLSAFGRRVVRAMNELGVLVDLSHAGERSFFDALEAGERPPIASHSGCRRLHDHPRNLTDEQLRALADAGGVAGIVFHPGFLDADARAEEARVRATPEYRAIPTEDETAALLAQGELQRARAAPYPASGLVDHAMHAIEVAGVDHVGIGSDFDGIERGPEGLHDASCYGTLAELLLARGLDAGDVRKVLGGNLERVFARATGPGTRAQGSTVELAPAPGPG